MYLNTGLIVLLCYLLGMIVYYYPLIGIFTYTLVISYYIFNHSDPDNRIYTWDISHHTIKKNK